MTLVAGVDSSAQSCTVVVRDADTGALVRRGRAGHPAGTEIDPEHWWTAFERAALAAGAAGDLVAELGPDEWAARTGSVPLASFTVTKLRWLAEHEPEAVARTAAVSLPQDWLSWRCASRADSTP